MNHQRLLKILLACFLMVSAANAFVVPVRLRPISCLSSSIPPSEEEEKNMEVVVIEPGKESEAISDDLWEEIDGAQPPKWIVMKEVRCDFL